MSKFDALRGLMGKVPWLAHKNEEPMVIEDQPNLLDDMRDLLVKAGYQGKVDRESGTWMAVSGWAAKELFQTFADQETASDVKAAALRARASVLRELLSLEKGEAKEAKFENQAPFIP